MWKMSEIIRTASQRFLRTLERGAAGIVILLFIFAFLGVYFAPRIFVTIHSGEVGVMYYRFFGGTQTDLVLGEGVKLVMPWDRLYVYNVRVQEVRHSLDVLSNEGLTIKLHLSIRYHPEKQMVGMLQKTVGQNYKNLIVVPEVESAMRTIMGQFQMRQVYGSERGLIQKVINDSLEDLDEDL